jgi:hypothetical protein
MSLIKKKDVSMHFAGRLRKGLHLVKPVGKSTAMGARAIESALGESLPGFAEDFSSEHSSPGGAASAVVMVESCVAVKTLETPE